MEHQKTPQTTVKRKQYQTTYKGQKPTPKSTPEATALFNALIRKGVPAELEKFDGYKHIDIAITEAKVYIEVDGGHHNFNRKQALADLKRTYYSFKKDKCLTLRIPNSLIKNNVDETAEFIVRFLNENVQQIEADLKTQYPSALETAGKVLGAVGKIIRG